MRRKRITYGGPASRRGGKMGCLMFNVWRLVVLGPSRSERNASSCFGGGGTVFDGEAGSVNLGSVGSFLLNSTGNRPGGKIMGSNARPGLLRA